jgi:hypothetical protein
MSQQTPTETFLPSRQVLARFSVSSMTLHRWCRDEKLAFPVPVYINNRRYWRLSELALWERARIAKSCAEIDQRGTAAILASGART